MEGPVVTVVMVQRDRFSVAARAIERLYDATDEPFELVYVDGHAPRSVRRAVDALQRRHGFTILRTNHFLTPNHARSIGFAEVRTPFVVFLDNDCLVLPGCLGQLVRTAEETGASLVGPLYAEGDPVPQRVHVAGGDIRLTGEPGERTFVDTMRLWRAPFAEHVGTLDRGRCDFVEFHCLLARTDMVAEVGGFDERLLSAREHLDFCMQVTRSGGEIWVEPHAVATFGFPPVLAWSDLPYFTAVWSERWGAATIDHFCEKYGLADEYHERGRAIYRSIRWEGLVERPRTLAGRLGGPRARYAVERAFAATVRRVEPAVNRRIARPPRPPSTVERIPG